MTRRSGAGSNARSPSVRRCRRRCRSRRRRRRRRAPEGDDARPVLNDALETLDPLTRRRLEDDRLVEQIAYDVGTSPFYRASLDGAGVQPDEIRHVEDLARIPFMEKTEVADSQADGTLLGINQCAPLDASSASRPPAERPAGRCGSA